MLFHNTKFKNANTVTEHSKVTTLKKITQLGEKI